MKKSFRPGETVPESGLYEIMGPRGGDTGKEVTAVKGKTFPPQPRPGETYKLAERARHKRPK
jgi:hypothetical protein